MSSLLLAAALAAGLGACSGVSNPPTPSSNRASSAAVPTPSIGVVQPVLDQVLLAARRGDRPAYDGFLSATDPVFADRARQLFDNLSSLPLTQLQARLLPDRRPLAAARQQLLGPGAWTQPAIVSWRLAGDTGPADHLVWFTFRTEGGGVRLAGLIDAPPGAPTARQPAWWVGPVNSGRRGGVTVVTGAGQPLDAWLSRGDVALTEVRRYLPEAARRTGPVSLVIEIPATTTAFEQVVGTSLGSYAEVAAVTLAEGDAAGAALRIVVNPAAVRRLTDDGLGLTLVHESVHVLTRSPESPAPAWAVEGLADWVALQAHPQTAAAAADRVRADVRANGPPKALPADAVFQVDAGRLDLAYAQAWSVCRYVAVGSGPEDLGRLYAELDRGRSLDQAASAAIGQSGAGFTDGWRRSLTAQARSR